MQYFIFFLYFVLFICYFRYGVNFSSPEIDLLFSKLPSEANGFINFEELVQYSFLNYNVSSRETGEGQSGKLSGNSYFLFDINCFIDAHWSIPVSVPSFLRRWFVRRSYIFVPCDCCLLLRSFLLFFISLVCFVSVFISWRALR